jgi:hypothetical protein
MVGGVAQLFWTRRPQWRETIQRNTVDNLFLHFISPRRAILFLMEIYLTAGYELSAITNPKKPVCELPMLIR